MQVSIQQINALNLNLYRRVQHDFSNKNASEQTKIVHNHKKDKVAFEVSVRIPVSYTPTPQGWGEICMTG